MKQWIKKSILTAFIAFLCIHGCFAEDFVWFDGINAVTYELSGHVEPVVKMAAEMFSNDMQTVTGQRAKHDQRKSTIRIIELDKAKPSLVKELRRQGVQIDSLRQKLDGFLIKVLGKQIVIVGVNGRGTAYGLLELSRLAGVSPWVWWGDNVPARMNKLTLDNSYYTLQGASVEYRGIFINDEDWTLRPWSYGTYEPAAFGQIGPQTYKKVFQLLLRLRANAVWPAMHTGTTAFFKIHGAKSMADSCGIVIGSSHCEPLLRNNVDEWDVEKRGDYNYMTNRKAVQDYWIERLREVKGSSGGNMFTIGMRGIHDGSMEGVKTMTEKFNALQQVIDDQQALLKKYIGYPSKQMQVFVPYKEVLQIYEKGLKVPDYVTLMWCDDNYGYMTRLSDYNEQKRSGGGGVYYHLSYWGRPHDYMWLCTTQPGLIYNEMRAAFDHNVRKLWIVNVHDPKVASYDLELFLDMAWNIDCVSASTVGNHYKAWLCREFGQAVGNRLYPAMFEYFRLTGERKPEFMGWNQVELDKKLYARGLSPVVNTELSLTEFGGELDRYLERFAAVKKEVLAVENDLRPELCDAYFAAIKYPVLAAEAQARKMLEAQRARSYATGSTRKGMFDNNAELYTATAKSQKAYQDIRQLTEWYNNKMAEGKWRRSMNMRPRDLPVFAAPSLPTLLSDNEMTEWLQKAPAVKPHSVDTAGTIVRNAADYDSATHGVVKVSMLGHSMNAVALPKGGELKYTFNIGNNGDYTLLTALIPTQPNDNGDLRYSVSVDGTEPTVFSLKEKFRSEQWKLNVLRGQARHSLKLKMSKGTHTLAIKALDNHIIVDQWMIDSKVDRKFYLFPVK